MQKMTDFKRYLKNLWTLMNFLVKILCTEISAHSTLPKISKDLCFYLFFLTFSLEIQLLSISIHKNS